jgi:hypothetical protein
MPGAANEDAQRGFKFADGLIRWRQGDKSAADALPVPTDASDTGATFCTGSSSSPKGTRRPRRRASSRSSTETTDHQPARRSLRCITAVRW